ncbi:MAG: lytic transglycosylase domain-containing protein [Nitrospiraceae bacterium]|nr:lytic transglycosylase domain-containing protein [Nitrospiraceae bacterium]
MFILIIAILLATANVSDAEIYKQVDDDGVILYTNAPAGKKNERVVKEKKERSQAKTKHQTINTPNNYKGAYSQIAEEKAKENNLDPSLVHAVIKTESNWNHQAVSRKGAMGLMQLMPNTANAMKVKNPFDPEENIQGGTKYLRYLVERFNGNLTLALAAYNAGPTTVEKYGSIPPISETRKYVKKVMTLYNGTEYTINTKKPENIYKIVLEDGSVLFTNSPVLKNSSARF